MTSPTEEIDRLRDELFSATDLLEETRKDRDRLLMKDVKGNKALVQALRERDQLALENAALKAAINTPKTDDYFEAVRLEAAHQIQRWGTDHDAGKEPADWLWLIGYLAGKAVHDIRGKRAHHIVATAAAVLNWHRAVTGESTAMRPGIAPPPAEPER